MWPSFCSPAEVRGLVEVAQAAERPELETKSLHSEAHVFYLRPALPQGCTLTGRWNLFAERGLACSVSCGSQLGNNSHSDTFLKRILNFNSATGTLTAAEL